MKKWFSFSIFLSLFFVFLFNQVFTPDFAARGDYSFHFEKSAGLTDRVYAPLGHIFGGFFSYSQNTFLILVTVIVGLVTPVLLALIGRNWQAALFFFATQYFWFMLSTISQALASIFLLGLFVTKNNYLRFVFFVLAGASHGQGFILVGMAWLVILFFENFDFKNFFPACGSLLGKATPDIVNAHLGGSPQFGVSVGTILNLFFKIIPFPFLYFGLKQLWKEKNFAPIVIGVLAFGAMFLSNNRTNYIIPLMILPFVGKYCSQAPKKLRWGFYVLSFSLIALQVWSWVRVKTTCV